MRTALIISAALAAGPALAQYRCTQPDGSVAFQQAPCPAQARAERLVLPVAVDDGRAEFRADAARGHVRVGMTRAEVDTAMRGAPDKINRSVVAGRVHDQLIYRLTTGPAYLYVEDGRLVSWQYTPPKE
jgi:hypothetical protein